MIDYDSLAQQHGGVDYDELAKQAGGQEATSYDFGTGSAPTTRSLSDSVKNLPNDVKTAWGAPGNPVPFVVKDTLGIGPQQKTDSFFGNLFQSTLGSKGLAGIAQLPGKVISTYLTKGADQNVAQSAGDLAHITTQLIHKAQSLPDGDPRKMQLLNTAQENMKSLGISNDELSNLEGAKTTAGQAAGTGLNAGLTAATFGAGAAPTLPLRTAEGGVIGGGYKLASNLQEGKPLTKGVLGSSLFGAAIPLAGEGVSKLITGVGKGLKAVGEKIQLSKLRPSSADLADGFNIANVRKYGVGGSLGDSLVKTNAKLNDLTTQLNDKLQSSDHQINLQDIFDDTASVLKGSKAKNFGENKAIHSQLDALAKEINEVGASVSIPDAQLVKQAVGTKGSWVYGRTDPEARASEVVYDTFYNKMKTAIEKNSPEGVREINKQISELIPIRHAILRRLPVEERANAISLTDAIGLFESFSNPKALLGVGLNKALKSGKVGAALTEAGSKIVERAGSKTNVGAKIFGR
ncbi:MAG: hypothetical protein ACLGJB_17855 [Blastocatellia bacterium]